MRRMQNVPFLNQIGLIFGPDTELGGNRHVPSGNQNKILKYLCICHHITINLGLYIWMGR